MIESFVKMKKIDPETKAGCVAFASKIMGDKWNPLIIQGLFNGSSRFSHLQTTIKVNPRTLSARLDYLEASGIVTRTMFNQIPPKVEYALTAKGKDLMPIITSMINWGNKYG